MFRNFLGQRQRRRIGNKEHCSRRKCLWRKASFYSNWRSWRRHYRISRLESIPFKVGRSRCCRNWKHSYCSWLKSSLSWRCIWYYCFTRKFFREWIEALNICLFTINLSDFRLPILLVQKELSMPSNSLTVPDVISWLLQRNAPISCQLLMMLACPVVTLWLLELLTWSSRTLLNQIK